MQCSVTYGILLTSQVILGIDALCLNESLEPFRSIEEKIENSRKQARLRKLKGFTLKPRGHDSQLVRDLSTMQIFVKVSSGLAFSLVCCLTWVG